MPAGSSQAACDSSRTNMIAGDRVECGDVPTFIFVSAERGKMSMHSRVHANVRYRKEYTNRDSGAQTMAPPAKMVANAVIEG